MSMLRGLRLFWPLVWLFAASACVKPACGPICSSIGAIDGSWKGKFGASTAISGDGLGTFYLADPQHQTVWAVDTAGVVQRTLGGPGFGGGQFDDPVDVDASAGLIIAVADAGNRRIQLFSRDGRFLEQIPMPNEDLQESAESGYMERVPATSAQGSVPSRVAWGSDERLMALTADGTAFVLWDRDRVRPARHTIDDRTSNPDIATLGRHLVVSDLDTGNLWVYDSFGTLASRIAVNAWSGTVSLTAVQGALWLVGLDALLRIPEERLRDAMERDQQARLDGDCRVRLPAGTQAAGVGIHGSIAIVIVGSTLQSVGLSCE